MKSKKLDDTEPLLRYKCYTKNDVLYVPTYRQEKMYANPGGGVYTEEELLMAGARICHEYLWETPARNVSNK